MEDLVLQSERLAMLIDRDLEMPRIKRNLSQILSAGNQMWNRTVGTSANRDASEVRASVLLGARGYDYQKVSRNLDSLVSRGLKHHVGQTTQPMPRDIKGFVGCERESCILKIIEETKSCIQSQVEKLYWDTVQGSWKEQKLDLLNTISSVDLKGDETRDHNADLTRVTGITDLTRVTGFTDLTRSFAQPANPEEVAKAAQECEQNGQFEEAIKLYDSISEYERVLDVLTMLLSDVVPKAASDSERSKLEDIAINIANKYSNLQIDLPPTVAGTFYLLLDLMTFFNYYHLNQYSEALDTIYKLKILPSNPGEVETKSRQFNRYPEEIRCNIAEILIATMNILYASYRELPDANLKEKAKALITYSGMIDYRLPSDTIARMIELEVLIN